MIMLSIFWIIKGHNFYKKNWTGLIAELAWAIIELNLLYKYIIQIKFEINYLEHLQVDWRKNGQTDGQTDKRPALPYSSHCIAAENNKAWNVGQCYLIYFKYLPKT